MIEIHLLGPVELLWDGKAVALQSRKAAALLAYLACMGRRVSRPALAELFWPSQTEPRGRANLSWVLSHLRKHLPGCLAADVQAVAFVRPETAALDIDRFRRLARSEALDDLERALALARGELLAGFALDGCPEFELWLTAEREQWRQRVTDVALQLVQRQRAAGNYAAAIEHARRLLALAPWREAAHRELVRLLALTGQRTAALAQYERCRRILAEELGVAPSPATLTLVRQVEAGPLDAALAEDLPMLRLPRPATTFIGRETELTQIDMLLAAEGCRLLTLLGIGGIGKTRLAIAAAHRLAPRFRAGACFVALEPLDDPAQVMAAIAGALPFQPAEAEEGLEQQLIDYLAGRKLLLVLDNMEQLLPGGAAIVSRLLERAPGVKVMATSRRPLNLQAETVLAVEGMGVAAAETGALHSGSALHSSAVALFLERARRMRPDLALAEDEQVSAVSRLAQITAGHPLALELAAAQLRLIPLETIVADLARDVDTLSVSFGDVPARHHSITAVFDYSWRALSEAGQELLGRLSLHRNGCTTEAASAIGATRTALWELVQHGLLALDGGRYRMHELVRHYARQKLSPPALQEAAAQHAHYYLAWLGRQAHVLQRERQREMMRRVRTDLENVRVAWQWAFGAPGNLAVVDSILDKAADGLFQYWRRETHHVEGAAMFAAAAAALETWPEQMVRSARLRAYEAGCLPRALVSREQYDRLQADTPLLREQGRPGDLAFHLYALGRAPIILETNGDLTTNLLALEESLSLYQSLDDAAGAARVRMALGRVLHSEGRGDDARQQLEDVLPYFRREGDGWSEARVRYFLGQLLVVQGRFTSAKSHFARCRRLYDGLDYRPGMATAVRWLGNVAYHLGRYDEAHAHYLQALAMSRACGSWPDVGRSLNNLGVACIELGEYEQARRWLIESRDLFQAHESMGYVAMVMANLGLAAEGAGKLQAARDYMERALQLRGVDHYASILNKTDLAYVLIGLGELEAARRQLLTSLRLSVSGAADSWILRALLGLGQLHALDGRGERAVLLAGLAASHPAVEHTVTRRAQAFLTAHGSEPPEKALEVDLERLAQEELAYWEVRD